MSDNNRFNNNGGNRDLNGDGDTNGDGDSNRNNSQNSQGTRNSNFSGSRTTSSARTAATAAINRAGDGDGNNDNLRFVDDRNPRIRYSDNWDTETGTRGEFKRTSYRTRTKGATATFSFNGDAVAVHATVLEGNRRGAAIMAFSVDGEDPAIFRQPETDRDKFRERVFFKRLQPGNHTLTMTGRMDREDGFFQLDFIAVSRATASTDAATPSASTTAANGGNAALPPTASQAILPDEGFDLPDPDDDGPPLPTEIPLFTSPTDPFTLPTSAAELPSDPSSNGFQNSEDEVPASASTGGSSPALSPLAIGVTVASLTLLLSIIVTLLIVTRRRRQLKRKGLHLKFDQIMQDREKYDFAPDTSAQFSTVMPSMYDGRSQTATSWRDSKWTDRRDSRWTDVPSEVAGVPSRAAITYNTPVSNNGLLQVPQRASLSGSSSSNSSYGTLIPGKWGGRPDSSVSSINLPSIPENTPVSGTHPDRFSYASTAGGTSTNGRLGVPQGPPSRLRSSVAMSIETISEKSDEWKYDHQGRRDPDTPTSPRTREREESRLV